MSDTLTKKLRRAARPQHANVTPNATPNTIPQSFPPPDRCQCIASAVARRKTTDIPLNTTPRIAALLAVHSLTGLMVRQDDWREHAISLKTIGGFFSEMRCYGKRKITSAQ